MMHRNPTNGYTEESSIPFLWCFLFGSFYFVYKGIWTHVLLSLIFAAFTLGISWFIYPFFARGIVDNSYLRKGWEKIY